MHKKCRIIIQMFSFYLTQAQNIQCNENGIKEDPHVSHLTNERKNKTQKLNGSV